jgi:hypothetical protein
MFLPWYVLPSMNNEHTKAKVKVMLRPTVSRSFCLGIKHPFGAYDQIFVTVRHFWVCSCGAPSLTRWRVCHLQLLLALASAVIFGSESRGTPNHVLLSQFLEFPFRRLPQLAGLRWRISTPPQHRIISVTEFWVLYYDRRSVGQSVLE